MVVLATGWELDSQRTGHFQYLVKELGGLTTPLDTELADMALEHMAYPAKKDKAAEVFFRECCLVALRAHTWSLEKKGSHVL